MSNHDCLLFYGKESTSTFNVQYIPVSEGTQKRWKGKRQNSIFRDGVRFQVSTDTQAQTPCPDWWDISIINRMLKNGSAIRRRNPSPLLERVLKASSNEGDLVLDPFCGCGTTIHAAQNLGRRWIGIDICVNACKVIEERIKGHFDSLWSDVEFVGLPKTCDDAHFMASNDPFRFERWAASLVDGMEANKKQRGDGGYMVGAGFPSKRVSSSIWSPKSMAVMPIPPRPRVQRGKATSRGRLGIFTCFEERATTGMRNAAVNTGIFMDAPVSRFIR